MLLKPAVCMLLLNVLLVCFFPSSTGVTKKDMINVHVRCPLSVNSETKLKPKYLLNPFHNYVTIVLKLTSMVNSTPYLVNHYDH